MLVLTVPFSCVKEELAGSELCPVYVFCHCTPRRPDTLSISLQRAALEKNTWLTYVIGSPVSLAGSLFDLVPISFGHPNSTPLCRVRI